MSHKRKYLKYVLPVGEDIVILSTKLAELLNIPHNDLLNLLEKSKKEKKLSRESTIEVEDQKAITKLGIRELNLLLPGNEEIFRNIIDAMIEMTYLVSNSEVLQNWILGVQREVKFNLEELQSDIDNVLQKSSQKRQDELYNILTPQERKLLGLTG